MKPRRIKRNHHSRLGPERSVFPLKNGVRNPIDDGAIGLVDSSVAGAPDGTENFEYMHTKTFFRTCSLSYLFNKKMSGKWGSDNNSNQLDRVNRILYCRVVH